MRLSHKIEFLIYGKLFYEPFLNSVEPEMEVIDTLKYTYIYNRKKNVYGINIKIVLYTAISHHKKKQNKTFCFCKFEAAQN